MQKQKIYYPKHWVDVPAQIRVLESRGLVIGDSQSAAEFLSYINYYRFTGYCLRFRTPRANLWYNVRVLKTCLRAGE